MKHRHENTSKAKKHFEMLLTDSFREGERLLNANGVFSIMFAHQSTEAWAAFIQAILTAGLNITASWPIDTERGAKTGAVQGGSYLASSVTVVCRKREAGEIGSFKKVRKELETVVEDSLNRFWQLGFRGADLIVSSFGPAVGVFGKYESVEKADGSPVTVAELLHLVQELAFRNIVGGLKADALTRAYVGWLNLYGVGEADYDDARQTVQMGTDVNIQDAVNRHVFEKAGNKVRLATLSDRVGLQKLGEQKNAPLIDKLHRAMLLWKQEKRPELVQYLSASGAVSDERIWKLAQALFETLPKGHADWKIIQALLAERSTLVAAAKQAKRSQGEQQSLV
jgi:adenine-specific DNA methylase